MVVRACARACALDGAAYMNLSKILLICRLEMPARCGAFSLLCRLKAHIKRRHRLGDARCAAYDGDCDRQLSAVRDDAPLICGPLFSRSALAAVGTNRGGSVRSSLVVDLGRLLAEEQDDGDLKTAPRRSRAAGRPRTSRSSARRRWSRPKKPRKKVKRKRPKDDSDDSDDDWGPGKN